MKLKLFLIIACGFINAKNIIKSQQFSIPFFAQHVDPPTNYESMFINPKIAGLTDKQLSSLPHNVFTQQCNSALYTKCGAAYSSALGFSNGMPADPQVFVNRLSYIMQTQGAQGLMLICRAGNNLLTCMGGQNGYNACINVPYLVKLGLSVQAAYTYVSIASQLSFECGPAYSTILNNYQCLLQTMVSSNSTLQGCTAEYMSQIQKDPLNTCKYSVQYVKCYTAPFTNACGMIVGEVICSLMRASFQSVLPNCPISCAVAPMGLSMKESVHLK